MDAKGIVIHFSKYPVKETIDRLQAFLEEKGITIYTRIDQQKEANNAGYNLKPLEFILFGNPKAGGAVMSENPLAALELPLKVIAWQDEQGDTRVAFNSEQYVKERYSLLVANTTPLNLEPMIELLLK